MPSTHVNFDQWNIPGDIQLADPAFYKPGPIDLLLGSELFFEILRSEKRTRPGDYPTLQNTELGWIISGKYQAPN
jgi:hypothetical protein